MKKRNLKGPAFFLIFLMAACLFAKTTADRDASVKIDKKTEKIINKALEALAGYQRKSGSFSKGESTGISSIAILALMASGSIPGEGEFAAQIGRGIGFLIKSQKDNGILWNPETWGGPMYHHALATQVLAECLGMTLHPDIRNVTIKAVDFIVHAQHEEGGWRYQPREKGDMSVTVMQVMALKAASKGGIYVPKRTIEKGIQFIKHCYNPKQKGFGYMDNKKTEFPRTAAGLVCYYTVGLHNERSIPDIVKYIMKNGFNPGDKHYWYGHYYASIGLYHYGGKEWKTYYKKIKDYILKEWKKDDHKFKINDDKEALTLAWQSLVLSVPYRYIPMYNR